MSGKYISPVDIALKPKFAPNTIMAIITKIFMTIALPVNGALLLSAVNSFASAACNADLSVLTDELLLVFFRSLISFCRALQQTLKRGIVDYAGI